MDPASIIRALEFDASRHCPLVDNIPIPGMFVVPKTHPYMGHYSILLKEEGSLPILEENLSRLTDTAKRCLKALNSSSLTAGSKGMLDSSKKEEVELGYLRVAIYSLRSTFLSTLLDIGSSSSSSSQRHGQRLVVLTKLFYHCVVIAGDACHKKFNRLQPLHHTMPVRRHLLLAVPLLPPRWWWSMQCSVWERTKALGDYCKWTRASCQTPVMETQAEQPGMK